jgi:hypothetical protein
MSFGVLPLIWIYFASVTVENDSEEYIPHTMPNPHWYTRSQDSHHLIAGDDILPSALSPVSTPAQKRLAKLSCSAFGGPKQAQEMVYWQDIPSDAAYKSPFREETRHGEKWPRKYVVRV